MAFGYTETEQLDLFLEKVALLGQTAIIRSGEMQTQLSLSYRHMQPLKVDVCKPDDETLRSFLLVFRHFVAKGEPVYVNTIANLCWNNIFSDKVRRELKAAKVHWKQQQRNGAVGLTINEQDFDPSFVLDLMINRVFFHSDSRKRNIVKRLDWLSAQFVEHVFLSYLIEGTKYVVFLRNIILISRNQGLLGL